MVVSVRTGQGRSGEERSASPCQGRKTLHWPLPVRNRSVTASIRGETSNASCEVQCELPSRSLEKHLRKPAWIGKRQALLELATRLRSSAEQVEAHQGLATVPDYRHRCALLA